MIRSTLAFLFKRCLRSATLNHKCLYSQHQFSSLFLNFDNKFCAFLPSTQTPAIALFSRRTSAKKFPAANKKKKRKFGDEVIHTHAKSSKQTIPFYGDGMCLRDFLLPGIGIEQNMVEETLLDIAGEEAETFIDDPEKRMDLELAQALMSRMRLKAVYHEYRPNKRPGDEELIITEDIGPQPLPEKSERCRRPPIVTIMGHVDHGKTTLLDALRHSNITAQEHGGITQHIGAFSVRLPSNDMPVTFLDTPGHSAFAAMRQRGARGADIVVLVVAADDGVMEQTVESIKYANNVGVPLIVAINKCDRPKADPQRVRAELMAHDVIVEDLSGDTLVVEISALHSKNLDKLQEAILLQAEMMNLESTEKGLVEGVIIESSTSQGLGHVCTVIISRGTLRRGSVLVAENCWGRVRSMQNEFDKSVDEAGPSCPIRISGWRTDLPMPGEPVYEVESEARARAVIMFRTERAMMEKRKKELTEIAEAAKVAEKEKHEQVKEQLLPKGVRESSVLNDAKRTEGLSFEYDNRLETAHAKPPKFSLLLKCDVEGSLEALQSVFESYSSNEKIRLDVIKIGVGPITEPEFELAKKYKAHVYFFNVPIPANIREQALASEVKLEQFRVIYKLVETLKEQLNETLNKTRPLVERKVKGEGVVIKEFRIADRDRKKQPIAGVRVVNGEFDRKAIFRFVRQQKVNEAIPSVLIYEGRIESMQKERQVVNVASTNDEVAISVAEKMVRYKEDDLVECIEEIPIKQSIDWNPIGF